MIKIFLFNLSFTLCCVSCSLKSDYYQKLILQEATSAQNYTLPTNNENFREGIEASTIRDFGSYDFIIVGAGSAGSVLATRLSEINSFSILLIEAGGQETDFSKIPIMLHHLQFSEMNWGYFTTPQKNCCLAMINNQCNIPRGKVLGGSSSINALIYSRGVPGDYDKWEELGNPGWAFKDVLPYFLKSENSQINSDPNYHGVGGFWNVEYARSNSKILNSVVTAWVQSNQSAISINEDEELGASRQQLNTKNGVRQSTNTAFLMNARKRKNLTILKHALVTKVIIDPITKIAQGIEFVTKKQKFRAIATKEVILSGGAINSPQILMLSGVGPKKHLQELGIEVIEELPVGQQLLDHPLFTGLILRTNQSYTTKNMQQIVGDYLNGLGTFTYPLGADFISFLNPNNKIKDKVPLEVVVLASDGVTPQIMDRVFNYKSNAVNNFLKKFNPSNDFFFAVILLHEKSKGKITLKSSSALDFPNIDLNFFSEQEDLDTLIDGIHFIRNLTETEAFKKIGAHFLDIQLCTETEMNSKEYWECLIRHLTATVFHPCSTTPMGPNSTYSVVDKDLKVYGIKNLRVIDAGVLPTTVSGHTNAPVVMIAEKMSDTIKKNYGFNL